MKRKEALVTGVTGQDGAYLSELLLKKNYIVHGVKRLSSSFNTQRNDHLYVDAESGQVLVEIDERYFRPTEVDLLLGDPRKAHAMLGWKHTTSFKDMVAEMVAADLELIPK